MSESEQSDNNNNGKPPSIAGRHSESSPSGSSSRINNPRPPSLLQGLNISTLPHRTTDANDRGHLIPPRPRRLWKVSDTQLCSLPLFYPPLVARQCVYVSDAPPSVVAIRIAEALRVGNVAVDYDDDNATATAVTIDRCHLNIYLWRANSASRNAPALSVLMGAAVAKKKSNDDDDNNNEDQSNSSKTTTSTHNNYNNNYNNVPLDFTGVIVECQRVRGSTITFGRSCRMILAAALSQDNGKDRRLWYYTSPLEYTRLKKKRAGADGKPMLENIYHSDNDDNDDDEGMANVHWLEGLEHALELLRKDRLGPQALGMESLVALTDPDTSGDATALYASLALLGAKMSGGEDDDVACLTELHEQWILGVLVHRRLPLEPEVEYTSTTAALEEGDDDNNNNNNNNNHASILSHATADEQPSVIEAYAATQAIRATTLDESHAGVMRAMALRTLSNALTLLARKQPRVLDSVLNQQETLLDAPDLIASLVEDVQGVARPPGLCLDTRLGSPHESVLAIRCLRLLGQYSTAVKSMLLKTDGIMETLEKARYVGKSTHGLLEDEAKIALDKLVEASQEQSSC